MPRRSKRRSVGEAVREKLEEREPVAVSALPSSEEPQKEQLPAWGGLGAMCFALAKPGYEALGAGCPPVEQWIAFSEAWGRVVDYYAPAWVGSPWPAAMVATMAVGAPLVIALPDWAQKRREKKEKARGAGERKAA